MVNSVFSNVYYYAYSYPRCLRASGVMVFSLK